MANSLENLFVEGHSIFSPPMFDGTNYTYWKARMRVFIQANDYRLWHIILNNIDINDSNYIYLNATATKLLHDTLDSHIQNKINSCKSAHDIWITLENIYERKLYEHLHVDYNESKYSSPEILVVENVVDSNQESDKIELSIIRKDSHQKLTHDKKDEAIINEMANSNEKNVDYNEVSYAHSFSNDSFDDYSALYYDDDIVDDHVPYDELLDAFDELFVESKKLASKNSTLKKHIASLIIELENLKKDANILKCENDAIKIENATLKIASLENGSLKNDNMILKEKLKELSSNHENEIVKNKIEKSTTSHFACYYCGKNGHISHTCPIKRKSKNCVKQVWMPKKTIYANDIKANTQGPHEERVPEKKAQYFVGTNTKKRDIKDLKENTSKVHNSRKNTKSLKMENTSQVFYPKRKREIAYKKNEERRYNGEYYSTVDKRKTSNEYIHHPHFNDKTFFTYNEYNGKITWAKVPNR